jgi:hypothetical protein
MPLLIPGLGEFVVAIVSAIYIWALTQAFGPILQSMASHVPVIGGALSRAVGVIIADAGNAGRGFAEDGVRSATGMILAPTFWSEHLAVGIINAVDDAAQAIAFVAGPALNNLFSLILVLTRALIAQTAGALQAAISSLASWTQQQFVRTDAVIALEAAAETAYISAVATALESELAAEAAVETAYTTAIGTALQSEIAAEAVAETAYTTAAVAAETAFVEAEIAAVTAVEQAEFASLTAYVTAVSVSLEAQIAAVEATSINYTTQVTNEIQTEITNLENGCLNDMCSGLRDLTRLFKGLEGDLGIAGLIALAAAAAADPVGTAGFVNTTFGPIARASGNEVRTLIGL